MTSWKEVVAKSSVVTLTNLQSYGIEPNIVKKTSMQKCPYWCLGLTFNTSTDKLKEKNNTKYYYRHCPENGTIWLNTAKELNDMTNRACFGQTIRLRAV